jgi:hypothetical protein
MFDKLIKNPNSKTLMAYNRGSHLNQLWEPHFRRQQSARAMYSTLKYIKIKVPLGFD